MVLMLPYFNILYSCLYEKFRFFSFGRTILLTKIVNKFWIAEYYRKILCQATDVSLFCCNLRFEVLVVVKMTVLFFWVVTPCGLLGRYSILAEDGDSIILQNIGICL
jgi:hypothetical protein